MPARNAKGGAMKVAIDSYCYHRYFGEIYPNLQADPGTRIDAEGGRPRPQGDDRPRNAICE